MPENRLNAVKKELSIFSVGLLLYAISFVCIAVVGTGSAPFAGPNRGYMCALLGIVAPLVWGNLWSQGLGPILMPTALVSGLINPLFLAALVLASSNRHRAFVFTRTIVVLMLPFCWIVFKYGHFQPREGYFLWISGILLALFSKELVKLYKSDRSMVD